MAFSQNLASLRVSITGLVIKVRLVILVVLVMTIHLFLCNNSLSIGKEMHVLIYPKTTSGRRKKNLIVAADSGKGASGTGGKQEKGDLLFITTIHHYIYYQLTHEVRHELGNFKIKFKRKSYITQQV